MIAKTGLVCPTREDPSGCRILFEDPEFENDGRDAVYCVRAIEAPSLAVNGHNLRCDRDAPGACIEVDRCGTKETIGDACLAETEQRIWSSPIFVDWGGS